MDFQNPVIKQHLRLGLCCINTVLRSEGIFCSRTCIRRTFTVLKAQQKALDNIHDLIKLIEWNEENGIRCFRISSDLFPHFTDDMTPHYTIDFAKDVLKEVGLLIAKYGHRITMHPGQFNQIGSNNPLVFDKTSRELQHHAEIMDAMGIGDNGVLIIHGGGTYKSKQVTMTRWIEQFHKLPDIVKKRLVIENCENNYSSEDCIVIAKACGIPHVFDFHHYNCWRDKQPTINELMPQIIATWENRTIVMHVSEQNPARRLGAHSDYVENIPIEIFETIIKYNIDIDLEIEAKMKEQAIIKLYKKYNYYTKFIIRMREKI